ncbi:mannose-1-phosphate guanyltransferase [Pseudidiomarina salinarum]|uniref:mannose-1-phosphate guanylyltransferase n=2 Tax=Pseudidiomarina salinarum TaxID=435908 RepID=A0A094JFR0_9GAMM|nr:mannose-1-phosphate guanyltransferase [Pseudidiomarina salinarum]RUO71565.1 mannose-1-phosphate guanylyltransferase/mannose-6-phosphate isomerase [Pseudidiomarina salinarum]
MAGGSGSRLWPLSRALYPKQFLRLNGSGSMLQNTITRLQGLECADPMLICNEEHRFIAAEQLRELGELNHNIILEPAGRNTAPAIALAAFAAIGQGNDPVMLVLAADHIIQHAEVFRESVRKALRFAEQDKLVTFGIVPTGPETGYGYIERGVDQGAGGFDVARFVEKPDEDTALEYIDSGEFYWNSGMFMFKASRYLKELKSHRPDIYKACEEAMMDLNSDLDFVRVNKEAFLNCPEDSVDYAVMEKTKDAIVVPMDAGWNDVGSWSSLWEVSDKDDSGNVHHGDVMSHNSYNNYVFAETGMVATVGIDDVVVVQTKDAVLVVKKDQVQDVKKIVEALKRDNRTEFQLHREVYRPWGKYDCIDNGARYQVKRITVKPGEKLSIQMHHHRAEHWVVVSGTANVTLDDETTMVTENESVYIPIGSVHSLENPGKIPLDLIEVQSGAYLGEDDIVRFDDWYGRS